MCRPIAPCLHARAAASARRFYSASSASDQLFASACSVTSCARSDARSSVAAMGRTGEDAAAATRRVTFALSYSTQAVATAAVEAATGVVEANCSCGMRLLLLKCCGRSSSASRGSRLFRTRLLCASAALVPLARRAEVGMLTSPFFGDSVAVSSAELCAAGDVVAGSCSSLHHCLQPRRALQNAAQMTPPDRECL